MELIDIYRSITPENLLFLLNDLNPVVKNGRISLTCPVCGEREAFTYFDPECITITCNRKNNCGYKETYLQFVTGQKSPKGEDFKRGISILTGLSFNRLQENDKQQYKRDCHTSSFKAIKNYNKEYSSLKEVKPDSPGAKYLAMRGISLKLAQKYGVKYAPFGQWCNYNNEGKLIRQWKPGRLVFPINDFYNKNVIKNLYGRTIEWESFVPKDKKLYKNFKHDQLPGAKGIFNFHPDITPKLDCVIFTEGILDALSLVEYFPEYKNKVLSCFGQNSLNWDLFKNVKNFLFAFDPDEAGQKLPLIKDAIKNQKNVYLVNKSFYKGLDLNEYWVKFKSFKDFKKNIRKIKGM